MFDIEVISSRRRFAELRSEWNALLANSRADGLFLTWEWLYTWWTQVADARYLFIVTLRHGSRLVAIAPLAIRGTVPRTVEFLGVGSIGSDYLDFIIDRGHEAAAAETLATFLALNGAALRLPSVKDDSVVATSFAAALRMRGWRVRSVPMQVCPFIDLRDATWDSYLARVSSSHRYNVRRRLRNLERTHSVAFVRPQSEADCRFALQQVIALHLRRWNARGGSDGFHEERLIQFHHEFIKLACANGWLRLRLLTIDGRTAGAFYGFRYGAKYMFYQSGFDESLATQSVGLVTLAMTMQEAIEEGASEYDMLHGDESYKFLWARDTRPLSRMEFYPPGVVGRIHRDSVAAVAATKSFVRRALDVPVNR